MRLIIGLLRSFSALLSFPRRTRTDGFLLLRQEILSHQAEIELLELLRQQSEEDLPPMTEPDLPLDTSSIDPEVITGILVQEKQKEYETATHVHA